METQTTENVNTESVKGRVLAEMAVRLARVADRLAMLIAHERDRSSKPSAKPNKSEAA